VTEEAAVGATEVGFEIEKWKEMVARGGAAGIGKVHRSLGNGMNGHCL
jgi:hypothetical protein